MNISSTERQVNRKIWPLFFLYCILTDSGENIYMLLAASCSQDEQRSQRTDSNLAASFLLWSHKEPSGTTWCFIRCQGLFTTEVFHRGLSCLSICSWVQTHTHTHTHIHRGTRCKTFTHPPPLNLLCVYAALPAI